ncbi:nitrous oxide reductase family maturation protein NosD [Thiohalorhabdus denitrificans]|uniref:Nitrous oxidase accessory protein n=1 Tax=Thiohalorhabdus denitrificans TaxID=381306 RepID=A0A1G5HL05_9GAMM|nr:nitrous oxide reductase family maturation protein NosD [Thiohalorhabdus denitrificans]SCY64000.1 nitrous oxidase accessory protein [Thiohalorhabdus denitrificans]
MHFPARIIGLVLLAAGAACPAWGAELRPQPGEALQQVVDRAAEGDTVVVPEGTHTVEALRLDKALTLAGEEDAVLDGGGSGDVIRVTAPGVTIQGLEIRHSGMDLNEMNAGVFVEGSATGTRIEDCFIDRTAWGIWVDGAASPVIRDNRIHGNAEVVSPDRGNGVQLWDVSGALVTGNEIWETRDGIYIEVSHGGNVLHDNHLHHLRYGVHYMYSHRNEVTNNRTHDTRAGYALMMSDNLEVHHNRSADDEDYGLLLNYVKQSAIHHNRVDPGPEKCAFVYNAQYNDFHHNRFRGCEVGIHLTAGSFHNRIHQNAFLHSRNQVKYVGNREQEWSRDGRGNYWSDYLGWDTDGDGIGDVPYRPNDMVDKLIWKYPLVRILMNSPAVQTLRWIQQQFPALRSPGVTDRHPLMDPEGVTP